MRKSNTYNVFLDDSRTLTEVFYKFNNPIYQTPFVVVKNYNDFVEYIETQFKKDGSYPGFISFDFQLSDVKLSITEDKTIFFNEEVYQESGLESAIWIVNFCKKHNLPIPKYFIHDENSYGKRKINKVFSEAEKIEITKDPFPIDEIKEPIVEDVPEEVKIEEVVEATVVELGKLPFSRKEFFVVVKDILSNGPKTREELNTILLTQFPDDVPEKQRMTKINNLLAIFKIKGKIKNIGSRRKSMWCLTD